MGSLDGKVAFITGGARGQGRSHALHLAEQGADIVTIDVLADLDTVAYHGSTQADLQETVALVEKTGRGIVTYHGDVREQEDVDAAVAAGLDRFGRIDIVVANAGITTLGLIWELSEETWRTMLDINLTGVFHTVKATVPHMIEAGRGGSIIMIGSCAIGMPHLGHYSAAKNGVVGLMQSLAAELAAHKIRVNAIHPTTVATEMFLNEPSYRVFRPDLEEPTKDDVAEVMTAMNKLGVPWIEPIDTSNAVLWLACDTSRYVTGTALSINAGVGLP
jgi:SDR family mycofactocin-dependent oxidoreductase